MDEKDLNLTQIKEIIETVARLGGTSLKFGSLEILFGKQTDTSQTHPLTEITDQQHSDQNKDALEQEELRSKRDQIELMLLENPALAEKLIADGELVDDDDDGTDPEL